LPPELVALAGCRVHPVTGLYVVPSAATMRRIAHDIDADEQVGVDVVHAHAMATTIAGDADARGPDRLVAVGDGWQDHS
jgi:hypothetical protein